MTRDQREVVPASRKHPAAQYEVLRTLFDTDTPFFEIIEAASAAIWVLLPDLRAVYVNPSWRRYTGAEIADALDHGWCALVHADDRHGFLDALGQGVRERRPVAYECRARRPDGTFGWVRNYALPWVNSETDELRALIITATDVTRLRQTLARQAETADRLHRAVTGPTDGIWEWPDVSRPAMWWSPRCYSICDYAPSDIEATIDNFFALVHPDDAPRIKALLETAIATTTPYDAEVRIRQKDGEYRWCRGRAETSRDGALIRMSGSLQDIHAAKQSAAEIALLQERYQRAEAGSTNGLWEWDLVTDRMWYSENFEKMLGFSDLEALATTQKKLAKLFLPDDQSQVANAIAAHLRDHQPLDVDFRITTHTGETRWFRSRAVSQRIKNGRTIRLSGSLYDVHDLKMAQIALQEEQEKVRTTLSSLGEPLVTTDAEGRIEFVNAAAETLFGIASSDIVDRQFDSVFEFCDHEQRTKLESPVARLGGDEFAVLMEYCNLQQAERVAHAIRESLAGHRFAWQTRHFRIGVSIGLMMIDSGVGNVAAALKGADAACYDAKKFGRNRVQVFEPRIGQTAI